MLKAKQILRPRKILRMTLLRVFSSLLRAGSHLSVDASVDGNRWGKWRATRRVATPALHKS
jgi:hypothetical protein